MIDDIIEVLLALGADIIDGAIKEAREQDEEESRTYYAKASREEEESIAAYNKKKKEQEIARQLLANKKAYSTSELYSKSSAANANPNVQNGTGVSISASGVSNKEILEQRQIESNKQLKVVDKSGMFHGIPSPDYLSRQKRRPNAVPLPSS